MRRGKLIASALILIFTFSIAGFVNLTNARVNSADVTFYPWDIMDNASPVISINSPANCTTYYGGNVLLNFTVNQPSEYWDSRFESLEDVGYILDNNSYGPFPASTNLAPPFNFFNSLKLDLGSHSLQAFFDYAGFVNSIINGPIDLTTRNYTNNIVFNILPAVPTVIIQPVEFNGTTLLLSFTVNEPVSKISYSINNQDNASIIGSTTLTNLPYGNDNLTVYATNPAGNVGASQTVSFTIAKPEAFPTSTVAIVSGAVVVLVVCWFISRNANAKKLLVFACSCLVAEFVELFHSVHNQSKSLQPASTLVKKL